MANDGIDNLIPVRSKEEAREKGRKGGIASGIARREKKEQKKTIAQALEMILNARYLTQWLKRCKLKQV